MTCSKMNGNPNLYTHQPQEGLHSYAIMSGHPGDNPRDILGHDAGLVDFCCQFLAGDRVIGSVLIHRERHTECKYLKMSNSTIKNKKIIRGSK